MIRGVKTSLKRCFVPLCINSTKNSPSKVFLTVPPKTEVRNLWFAAASVTRCPPLRRTVHFCQDHFQPDDLMKLKSYGSSSVLEANIFPCRFLCQSQTGLVNFHNIKDQEDYNDTNVITTVQTSSRQRDLYCTTCSFTTTNHFELQQHLSRYHIKRVIPAKERQISYEEQLSIKEEIIDCISLDSGDGGCPSSEDFDQKSGYFCSKCDFTAPNQSVLDDHVALHMNLQCTECDYETKRAYNMKYHMMWHRGESPFQCFHCNYRCSKLGRLRSHMMKHTRERPYKCSFCDHRTAQSSNLKKHIMTHTDLKPYACSRCKYRGSTRAALTAHFLVHSGIRPFACPHCDYRSARSTDLKKHVLTHSDTKPLACSLCDYRCIQLGALKVHMATHSNDSPVPCPYCNYICGKIADLKRHAQVRHCGMDMYFCSDCSYFTITSDDLENHFMTSHYNPNLHSLLLKDYKLI